MSNLKDGQRVELLHNLYYVEDEISDYRGTMITETEMKSMIWCCLAEGDVLTYHEDEENFTDEGGMEFTLGEDTYKVLKE